MNENKLLERIKEITSTILNEEGDSDSYHLAHKVSSVSRVMGAGALLLNDSGEVLAEEWDMCRCFRLQGQPSLPGKPPECLDIQSIKSALGYQLNLEQTPYPCDVVKENNVDCPLGSFKLLSLPVNAAGRKLAELLFIRRDRPFNSEDLILVEVAAALFALILIRVEEELQQEQKRNADLATVAFDSLSFSEVEAIEEIFQNLQNLEGIVVASKIADHLGITRSVIVNALRKFESAGIIESRSLGMKGTFIRVKNPQAMAQVAECSQQFKHEME